MSFLKSKHSGWLSDGTRTPFTGGGGSGGGGGQPTQTTSYTTNIPEYARPYVENMLQSTQAQIYNEDMTGFRPYQPYSTDVNNYFAGFSPLQQSAQQAAYYMQTPGQFGLGTGLAGAAGIGGLSAADQASQLGGQALGYGAAGAEYGGIGAQQALARAQQTGRQAGMYGRMGAGYGAQAAGLAPTAQAFGQEAADIGMGGLGYGAMGAGYGGRGAMAAEQGFGAGEAFARQATDPYATQAYMSPYMQNVVDYQKSQALRDYMIGQPMRRAQAVGAGAFGGSRQAIAEAEAERSLMSQLQGIQATGTQKAFEDAQRQQQFGANLGLQGLQAGYGGLGLGMQGAGVGLSGLGTALQGQQARMAGLGQAGQFLGQGMQGAQAGLQGVGAQQAAGQLGLAGTAQGIQGAQAGMQGVGQAIGAGQYGLGGLGAATQAAGTLGQLGGQQLGAEKDIINLQSTMGAQQQALEQNKINQAIQDYAIAQQYPFMQLGMMNAMLRGLPLQTQTTQLYQAQPSSLQQGIGLAGAAGTLLGRKAGGAIKEYRQGGIVGYAPGGVIDSTRAKLEQIADMPGGVQKLEQLRSSSSSKEVREMAAEILVEKQMQAQAEQQAQKGRMSGIAMAGGPAFESQGMAGGGIIAFAGEGPSLVEDPQFGGGDFSADQARLDKIKLQKDMQQYEFLKTASPVAAERLLANNPMLRDMVAPPALTPAAKPEAKPPGVPPGTPPIDRDNTPSTGIKSLEDQMREQERLMGPNTVGQGLEAKIAERLAGMSKREKQDDLAALRNAFIKFGTEASPGGIGVAALKGIETYGTARDAAAKVRENMDLELTKMQADIKKGERSERRGNLDAAAKAFESAENRQLRLAEMQNQLKAAGISASRPGELEKAFALFQKDPVAFEQFIAAKDTNRGNLAAATKNILEAKYPNYKLVAMTPPEKRTKEQNEFLQNAYKDAEATAREMMRKGTPSAGGGSAGGGGNLVQNKDGSFNYVPR
jgi:hypothetical protein